MKPSYCDTCAPEIETKRQRENSERIKRDKWRKWKVFCPPLFTETDVQQLPQEQLKQCLIWIPKTRRSLLLHGTTGRGKTRIAWEFLRQRFLDMGECEPEDKIIALTAAQFSRASSDHAATGKSERWAKDLIQKTWLFIDDLGKGRLTERNESDLFDILDQRFAYKKPVIITTNTIGEELQKRLDLDRGEPLIRRLREFCDCIAF